MSRIYRPFEMGSHVLFLGTALSFVLYVVRKIEEKGVTRRNHRTYT
jgi:hypothetical protein